MQTPPALARRPDRRLCPCRRAAAPRALWPFIRWCLSGAWPVILVATLLSGLAGVLEVGAAWLLGVVIDTAVTNGPEGYFTAHVGLILFYIAFYLLLRPLFFGASAAFNGIVLPPNLAPPDPEPDFTAGRWVTPSAFSTTTSRAASRKSRCRRPLRW